jgi:SAM-dependent methyltransferase
MHTSSLDNMKRLAGTHLAESSSLDIIDLGSFDVNGSYRPIFDRPNWRYRGVDMVEGPNVDLVMADPYRIPLPTRSVDLVVSGQAFEHVELFWITFLEMVRILRPGGLIFLIAPSRGPEHRYPVDCWRFYPDGYRALARFGGVKLLDVTTDWGQDGPADSREWGDTVGVFSKQGQPRFSGLRLSLSLYMLRTLLPKADVSRPASHSVP